MPSSNQARKSNRLALMAFCAVSAIMIADAAQAKPPAKASLAATLAPLSDSQIEARANALLSQMTIEEKLGQLNIPLLFGDTPTLSKPIDNGVSAGRIGSVGMIERAATANRLQKLAMENTRLKIPLLFGFDAIHGFKTIFPVNLGLAASWDPELEKKAQSISAAEASANGVRWVFSPNVDIVRDPRFGRMVETSGEDPYLGAAMATAQVEGFQGAYLGEPNHVMAQVKHFAGYGAVMGGRDQDEVNLSESDLWNVYLPPFKAGLDAGAGAVMSAYTAVNGVPATGNKWLLTDVLRHDWNFKGIVSSDNNSVADLKIHGFAKDSTDAAIRGITAGVDIEMNNGPVYWKLQGALASGGVTQQTIDDAVRRVLETKIRLGLFEHPYVDEKHALDVQGDPAHRIEARIAAERSAVLLQNSNNLLPLKASGLHSVAVIGSLADSKRDTLGSWAFNGDVNETVTILQAIKDRLGNKVAITYAPGVRTERVVWQSPMAGIYGDPALPSFDADAEFAKALEAAKAADVVVMALGENQDMSGEAASRATLDLPGRQLELLKAVAQTGKPIVIVLMNGRPLDLSEARKYAPAILDVWYPGTSGGTAVVNLLFGDAVPGGKLPFTWPVNAAQIPMVYDHLRTQSPFNAAKRYWDIPSAPLYPFGYGLSYSTFAIDQLSLDKQTATVGDTITVSATVKNTGTVKADEVAELYIHQQYGSAARPVKELKGFERISLNPGESRVVSFKLSPKELTYWSTAQKAFVLEPSTYDVWVGDSSEGGAHATFDLTGTARTMTQP